MRQFIDVTGKTEEEAINRALEQLKLDRDDVSVEILERAKAGFLGLGSCPAKGGKGPGGQAQGREAPGRKEARRKASAPGRAGQEGACSQDRGSTDRQGPGGSGRGSG